MAKAKAGTPDTKKKLPEIVIINATILGTSALLLNPATEELLESLRTKVSIARDRTLSRDEEAANKLIRGADGKTLIIPIEYMLSSLIEAGRHVDFKPRTKVSTKLSTMLYSFMFGYPTELLLTDGAGGDPEYRADFRRGRNPKDGVMVALVRPRFDNWGFNVSFKVRTNKIDPSKVRELFEISGSMVGLGDFRPSCRGPFGCFGVLKWEMKDVDGNLVGKEEVSTSTTASEPEASMESADIAEPVLA